ncbi:MAG: response regulator [Planctomycetota bacterium]
MTSDADRWSDKQIFTTGEAAEVCGVSQQTIIRGFDAGRLGGFRVPGSKFRRIPRADLLAFMEANSIPSDILGAGRPRVLAVDDDPEILAVFEEIFGNGDQYELKCVSTGYDAGVATEAFKPNVILLDFMLPDINGDLVIRRLREHRTLGSARIILISGVVERDQIEGLLAAGADLFLKKPFDIDELENAVESLIGRTQSRDAG